MSSKFPTSAGVAVDERGPSVLLTLDPGLYPEDVVLKAAYWLTDRCYVHVNRSSDGRLLAEIRAKDGEDASNLADISGEFCNALIDFAIRARVSEETKDIQEALLQRAFVELVPKVAG